MNQARAGSKTRLGPIALLVLGAWGCSWHFMQPLPADAPPESPPDCSTNWMARMDGILAGAFVAASAMAIGSYFLTRNKDTWMPYPKAFLIAGGAYAVPALIFSSSAITGAVWAARCNEQYAAYRRWIKQGGQPNAIGAQADAEDGSQTALRDGRACPDGAHAHGAPPPAGLAYGCVLPGAQGQPVPHGPYTTWYESGVKASEGEYRQGKRDGQWTFWYPDGARKLEAHYHLGREVGHWIFWDQAGEIFRETDFGPAPDEP